MGYVYFMGKIMINHEFFGVLYLQTNLHFQVLTSDGEFFRGLTPKFAMISHRTRNVWIITTWILLVASHEHNFGERGMAVRPGRRAAECPLMPEPWADLELAVQSTVKSRVKIVNTQYFLCIMACYWNIKTAIASIDFSNNDNPIPLLLNTT